MFIRDRNYRELRDLMFSSFPDLQTAYELKEYYIRLNNTCSIHTAPDAIEEATFKVADAGIPELKPFSILLNNWRTEIPNSVTPIQ